MLAIAGTAPFIGQLRHWVFEAHLGPALVFLVLGLSLPALGLVGYALIRIRTRRWIRFGALGLAAGAVALQLQMTHGYGDVVVGWVERVHIVEYGLVSWLLYRGLSKMGARDPSLILLPLAGTAAAGAVDELVQSLAASRIGEIRDVGLDALAGTTGVLAGLGFEPPERFSWRLERPNRLFRGLAVSLLVLGGFFYQAHLGYEIYDREIGHFRSWFPRAELEAAAVDRADRWAREVPSVGVAFEDRFLTEAGWHAGHRDHNYRLGHLYWARQANLILEKYYYPYLDLEGFQGLPSRRYPERMLQELETTHPVDPETYYSPVLQKRIYIWPSKPAYLAALLSACGLLWFWPRIGSFTRRGRSVSYRPEDPRCPDPET